MPHLLRVIDEAAYTAEALERAALGHRIDTEGRTTEEITDTIVARIRWPGRQR